MRFPPTRKIWSARLLSPPVQSVMRAPRFAAVIIAASTRFRSDPASCSVQMPLDDLDSAVALASSVQRPRTTDVANALIIPLGWKAPAMPWMQLSCRSVPDGKARRWF